VHHHTDARELWAATVATALLVAIGAGLAGLVLGYHYGTTHPTPTCVCRGDDE